MYNNYDLEVRGVFLADPRRNFFSAFSSYNNDLFLANCDCGGHCFYHNKCHDDGKLEPSYLYSVLELFRLARSEISAYSDIGAVMHEVCVYE